MNNTDDILDEKSMAFDYIRANIAHEFRTQFTTIDVSLHSMQAILPTLIGAYISARDAGLVDVVYSNDYLQLLHKSVFNSINELKFADFYLNKLLVFLNKDKLGSGKKEKISMKLLLEKTVDDIDVYKVKPFKFESNNDFEIEYNAKDMYSCVRLFLMDIHECQKDQRSQFVTIKIDPEAMQLMFSIVKLQGKSRIYNSILGFMGGNHDERHGVGVYLFNRLLETQSGKINYLENDAAINFNIQF